MATKEKIVLHPHTGLVPVHGSGGQVIGTVEHDTGMKRIYYYLEEDGKQLPGGQQIGFLHPNGFLHFTIPTPPTEFVEKVKKEVERQTATSVNRVGAPPPIEAAEK